MSDYTHWHPVEVKVLVRGWQLGHSASKIAETLPGRSRDAVIGKANRMKLPPRPSPIIRKAS